ncbi:Uncharacterised protein [Chlamydia trachomatis]|nr:Uncharacterised protein [Chlamydia trachomatis]
MRLYRYRVTQVEIVDSSFVSSSFVLICYLTCLLFSLLVSLLFSLCSNCVYFIRIFSYFRISILQAKKTLYYE